MPRKSKQTNKYDPRQLHRELKKVGLKVISCDANGVVILAGDPSTEQTQLVASIKIKTQSADPAAK